MSKDSCSGFASTEIAADKPFILRQVSQTRAKNQHCPKQCDTEINAYVGIIDCPTVVGHLCATDRPLDAAAVVYDAKGSLNETRQKTV